MAITLNSTNRPIAIHRRRLTFYLPDPYVMFPAISLFVLGLFMIQSAEQNNGESFVGRQAIFGVAGILLMLILSFVDLRHIQRWVPRIYFFGIIALVLVLTSLGSEHRGSRAWFDVGTYQIQPSEFMKLGTLLMLASFITSVKNRQHPEGINLRTLGVALGIIALPGLLILLQPDAGSLLIYGTIALGVLVAGGINNRHLVLMLLALVATFILIFSSGLLAEYQEQRLTALIDPSEQTSYTQNQAQIAIGKGGFTGQGYGNGVQDGGTFVPEQHSDFIFTVIGEELGFLGGMATIGLYAILLFRIWHIARFCGNMFGMLICAGVIAMILFQSFQSIGMTLGIMPVTGVPLPFVSYGGSSLLTNFLAVGLVMSVGSRRPDPIFV